MAEVKCRWKRMLLCVLGILGVWWICISCLFFSMNNYMDKASEEYIAIIDQNQVKSVEDIGAVSLWDLKIVSKKDTISEFLTETRGEIILVLSVCFWIQILFVVGLFMLWKKEQRKKMFSTIKRFSLENASVNNTDDLINAMFNCMESNVNDQIRKFQRQNSYSAHEQKNLLGILSARYSNQKKNQELQILNKMNESIEDFLTLSDYSKENMDKIDILLITAEVCDTYRNIFEDIKFQFEEENDYYIYAKRRWIYRAISNLVDNAIKYGEETTVEVSLEKKYGNILVKVRDNGVGIEREDLDKIWNERFQNTDVKKDGYGIGLSLVAHVCDLCDGSYYVRSDNIEGTEFILSFPEAE